VRQDDLHEYLKRRAFQPFRLHLSTGAFFDIRQPQWAWADRSTLAIGQSIEGDKQRFLVIALIHIVWLDEHILYQIGSIGLLQAGLPRPGVNQRCIKENQALPGFGSVGLTQTFEKTGRSPGHRASLESVSLFAFLVHDFTTDDRGLHFRSSNMIAFRIGQDVAR
jgi:hypothetical protein